MRWNQLQPPLLRIRVRGALLPGEASNEHPVDLPRIPETYWSFKHALKFVGKRAAQPLLGLMTVAALLSSACKKGLVDTNVERLRDRDLAGPTSHW
jgi:hypothetical protein